MLNNDPFIKVHVTQVQREYLEFLVSRRINDLRRDAYGTVAPRTIGATAELEELLKIRQELSQAGT